MAEFRIRFDMTQVVVYVDAESDDDAVRLVDEAFSRAVIRVDGVDVMYDSGVMENVSVTKMGDA